YNDEEEFGGVKQIMRTMEKQRIKQAFIETMNVDELMNCTRCGYCLPSYPTYIETGQNEDHSPRGRIALMKGLVERVINPSEEVNCSLFRLSRLRSRLSIKCSFRSFIRTGPRCVPSKS